jgi:putative membrane protein
MQVMDSPDIRWSALAGEIEGEHDEEAENRDEHAETHTDYSLEDFRMAVVEGKHPNGESLNSEMPRWNISDGDLGDLAEFLKSESLTEKGEEKMNFMSGMTWIIFPIIGIICMAIFMFMMFNRGGGFMSRQDGPRFRSDRDEITESETPLSILKKRYAKGEISKEEYEEMKREF